MRDKELLLKRRVEVTFGTRFTPLFITSRIPRMLDFLPGVFYGRKTVQGYPTAVEMTLLIVKEPVGKVMADIGLHATEYEHASSPAESLLVRPASQFPWVLLDKGEGPPRYVRPNVSAREALLGPPDMSKRQSGNRREGDFPGGHSSLRSIGSSRSHEEDLEPTRSLQEPGEVVVVNKEYLEHLRFDGDDSQRRPCGIW